MSQIAQFMGPTWGPPGSCRPQVGPMLAPWTLLSWVQHVWSGCLISISQAIATDYKMGTRRFHRQVPNLQMTCRDLTSWLVPVSSPSNSCWITCPIDLKIMFFEILSTGMNFGVMTGYQHSNHGNGHRGPLLLTWFNFNPSMDKQ